MKYFAIEAPNAQNRDGGVFGPYENGPAAVRDATKAHGKNWQRFRLVVSERDLRMIESQINSHLSVAKV